MGVMDNVYALNYVINRKISKPGGKLIAFFVDWRSAFDIVDRGMLVEAMRERERERN